MPRGGSEAVHYFVLISYYVLYYFCYFLCFLFMGSLFSMVLCLSTTSLTIRTTCHVRYVLWRLRVFYYEQGSSFRWVKSTGSFVFVLPRSIMQGGVSLICTQGKYYGSYSHLSLFREVVGYKSRQGTSRRSNFSMRHGPSYVLRRRSINPSYGFFVFFLVRVLSVRRVCVRVKGCLFGLFP